MKMMMREDGHKVKNKCKCCTLPECFGLERIKSLNWRTLRSPYFDSTTV